MHFSLSQNNVNDYVKPCMRQYLASLKCICEIMLCPTITLSLAMPLLYREIINGYYCHEATYVTVN